MGPTGCSNRACSQACKFLAPLNAKPRISRFLSEKRKKGNEKGAGFFLLPLTGHAQVLLHHRGRSSRLPVLVRPC